MIEIFEDEVESQEDKFVGYLPLQDSRVLRLIEAIDGAPLGGVISFDIFDTLLFRKLFDPKDIFWWMGKYKKLPLEVDGPAFCKLRVAAEKVLRIAMQEEEATTDPSLDDIYDKFQEMTGFSKTVVDAIKAIEVETELEFIAPRPVVLEIFNYAVESGRNVILCSDMYLPRETLEAMLSKCGFEGYSKLYLSCEVGATKKHGTIFNLICEELDVVPSHVLHFGDNVKSDITMAEAAGWKALKIIDYRASFLSSQNPLRGLLPEYSKMSQLPCAASRLNATLISNRFFKDSQFIGFQKPLSAKDFGYAALGPFVLSLVLWIRRLAKSKNQDVLAFLARDGFLPLEVLKLVEEVVQDDIELKYLPISRRVLFPYYLQQPNGLNKILEIRCAPQMTIEMFLKQRFGSFAVDIFNDTFEEEALLKLDDLIKDHFDAIKEMLFANLDKLRAETRTLSENLLKRYKTELPANKSVALFDVGRKGSFQAALSQMTGQNIGGYYVVTSYDIIENAPDRNFDSYLGMMDKRIRSKNPDTVLYEAFLSERGGSFYGFEDDGTPMRDTTSEEETEDDVFVDDLHQGALEYVKEAIETYGKGIVSLEQEPFYASYGMENWTKNESAVELLSAVKHEDYVSSPVARTMKDYFLEPVRVDPWTLFSSKSDNKRVMIYCPAIGRIKGGAERITARIANNLRIQGYDVLIFSAGKANEAITPVYPLEAGVITRQVDVRNLSQICDLINAYDPDVGLVLASGNVVGRIGMGFLQKQIPYLLSERASPIESFENYWKGKNISRLDYDTVYETASIPSVQFASFKESFPTYLQDRIEVLPNPIELLESVPEINAREKTIICAARIWFQQKQQDILLNAFARICKKHPDWTLKFFGNAYEDDVEKLTAMVKRYGISSQVSIQSATPAIQEEFLAASIFVLPSAFEGFPNSLAEAMVCGLPSIGLSSCPGTNELIVDGTNGYLVKDDDVLQLGHSNEAARAQLSARMADKLDSLMSNEGLRKTFSKNALEKISHYSDKTVLDRWKKTIDSLCEYDGAQYWSNRMMSLALVNCKGLGIKFEPRAIQGFMEEGAGNGGSLLRFRKPNSSTTTYKFGAGNNSSVKIDHEDEVNAALAFASSGSANVADQIKLKLRLLKNKEANQIPYIILDTVFKPVGSLMLPIPDNFSENSYLESNQDVAEAIKLGRIQSGYFHYVRYGGLEGRERA